MIIQQIVEINNKKFKHTFSSEQKYIKQLETDAIYDEAYDTLKTDYHYSETDRTIEPDLEFKHNDIDIVPQG